MKILPQDATNSDKYLPAMKVQTEAEATEWFEICVLHSMMMFGKTRPEAEAHEREAIAVAAFYGFHESDETMKRIGRLFHIEAEFEKLKV